MELTSKSRALGAIWGACVGDALGGPVQFMHVGEFEPVTELQYVLPFHQPAGSYSDDGSMTLALAQSFIDTGGHYDHALSIKLFVEWLTTGRFSTTDHAWDVGISTDAALSIWQEKGTDHLRRTQRIVDEQLKVESCSGNGSLMRISPIGLVIYEDVEEAKRCARQQSQITHPAVACLEACELYIELLCQTMKGATKEHLVDVIARSKLSHPILAERLSKYETLSDWTSKSSEDLRCSGWVIDTLEVALWSFFKYNSWKEGALAVVNLGEDSDTAGAVYGALAGAFFGYDDIPASWIHTMQRKELISEIAGGVAELSCLSTEDRLR